MTRESNHSDPRVSEAYRSIATESTPPDLDRKILSMAAGNTRSRYGLARAWIRPVAWAATIGLSLAFVLEMSQIADVTTPGVDADLAEPLEERIVRDEAPAPAKDTGRIQNGAAERTDSLAPAQQGMPAARQASSPPATAEPKRAREARPVADGVSVSTEFEADDRSMLQEAEEQARASAGSELVSAPAEQAPAFNTLVTLEKKEKVEYCDADARSSAESWYACIEELRDDGLADAADLELAALVGEFPDFAEPQKSR